MQPTQILCHTLAIQDPIADISGAIHVRTWNMISGAMKVSLPITIMLPSGSRTLVSGKAESS